jgi:glycosyltransferase involved in cell wall biosynthesis
MLISIIIPTYNSETTISKCLAAIFAESDLKYEVFVSDDGSTDKTKDLAKSWPITLLEKSKNSGPSSARNIAAQKANGDILLFLDSDIVLNGSSLKDVCRFFESNPEVGAVTGVIEFEDNFLDWNLGVYKNFYMNFILENSCHDKDVGFLYGGLCAIRKKDFYLWPENIRFGEDTYLGIQLSRRNVRIRGLRSFCGIHLKNFTPLSFFRKEFLIAAYFVSFYFKFHFLNKSAAKKFSHVHSYQFLVMAIFCVSFPLSLYSPWLVLLQLLGVLLGRPFLSKIYKQFDIKIFFKSVIFYWYENLSKALGCYFGGIKFLIEALVRRESKS